MPQILKRPHLPPRPGIYRIDCVLDGKFYIGQSINVRNRASQHLSSLRLGKHDNKHLQSAYNLYGIEAFGIYLIEEVESHLLDEREQFWILETECFDRRVGFNRSADTNPGRTSKTSTPKAYIITPPKGPEFEVLNLTAYSRRMGFPDPDSVLHKVASGAQNSFQGYKCRHAHQTVEQWEATLRRAEKPGTKPLEFYVRYPSGEIVKEVHLTKFCKKWGITRDGVINLLRKPHPQCHSRTKMQFRKNLEGFNED